MKTLLLVRHAKAVPVHAEGVDRERPLCEEGVRDAKSLGAYLKSKDTRIDLALSSPAIRTVQTLQILKQQLGKSLDKMGVLECLYATDAKTLLRVTKDTDNQVKVLMLVGHNPELDVFASLFCEDAPHLKTCSLLKLKFNIRHWADIAEAKPDRIKLVG